MNKIFRIWNWLRSYTLIEYVLILSAIVCLFVVIGFGIFQCVKFLEDLTITYLIGM